MTWCQRILWATYPSRGVLELVLTALSARPVPINFAALLLRDLLDILFLSLEYLFIVAGTLMAFSRPVCAYVDFDGQNSPISCLYLLTSLGCLRCGLAWSFRSSQTLSSAVGSLCNYPRTLHAPEHFWGKYISLGGIREAWPGHFLGLCAFISQLQIPLLGPNVWNT